MGNGRSFFHLVGVKGGVIAGGSQCLSPHIGGIQCIQRGRRAGRSGSARCAGRAGGTGGALSAGGTRRSSCTGRPSRSSRTGWPGRAGRSGGTRCASGSGRTSRPGGALGTRRTRRACRTSRAGRSGRTGGTCRACGAGRACGSGGAGHGDQIKVRRGARRPGSAAAVGAVEGTVVVDQCAQVIRYPGNELCDIIQPFTGRAGGTCGADRTGRTGRSSGTRGSGRAVYLCTTLTFVLR